MKRYTQNDLDFYNNLVTRICDDFTDCQGCPFACLRLSPSATPRLEFVCVKVLVNEYLSTKKLTKTNAEKFKEIFGFPLYEVHQLSAQEEGEWLEHEYKEPDKLDEE